MAEKKIDIETVDGSLNAHLFTQDGVGRWPAVILNTDIHGVRPTFEAFGRRLAASGFVVLLPNLFYRLTRGPLFDEADVSSPERKQARMAEVRKVISVSGVKSDHAALLAYLAALPNVVQPKVGIVGYCLSGAIALRAAADFPDRIVAAASFHGGRLAEDMPDSPHLRAPEIKAALFLGYAENDQSMPPEAIVRLEDALRAAHVSFHSEHYPARHGYAVPDSAAYDELVAERHWTALIAFLQGTIGAS